MLCLYSCLVILQHHVEEAEEMTSMGHKLVLLYRKDMDNSHIASHSQMGFNSIW